jgi:soluble lytic murein transglycosylase-like protein
MIPVTGERFARGTGLIADRETLRDPEKNVTIGSRFLGYVFKYWKGFLMLVPPSYNAGEGAVQKYRNTIPPYPETRNYVKLVAQFYQFYHRVKADQAQVARLSDPQGGRRIRMTIPGRNLPAATMTTHE